MTAEEASRAWINECMVVRSRLLTLPATAAVRMMDGQTQADYPPMGARLGQPRLPGHIRGGAVIDVVQCLGQVCAQP